MKKMRVLLVAGGWSTEREISLKGAVTIAAALSARGHEVTLFDLSDGFEKLLEIAEKHDVAFLNLHGQPGEDGLVQALLSRAGCPYQGSGPSGSFLALNKAAGKALFRRAGLHTPDYEFLPVRPEAGWKTRLSFPHQRAAEYTRGFHNHHSPVQWKMQFSRFCSFRHLHIAKYHCAYAGHRNP